MMLGNTPSIEEQTIDLNKKMTEQDEQMLLGQDEVGPEEAQKLKTKIRRLYDIANVLQSIGLIEKTNHTYNKKPAFRWIGIHGVHAFVKELADERLSMNLQGSIGVSKQNSMGEIQHSFNDMHLSEI